MGLRPGRTTRKLERPYTRVSKSKPRKSYVVGVPFPKIHQFEMGDRKGSYNLAIYGIAKDSVQIRHNALEAARIVTTKYLEKVLGTNFFFKILKFPHHVLREKPIAQGAGADRYSQGMGSHPFGKPTGVAVQIYKEERLMVIRVAKENLETAKQAMKKASLKLSTPLRIEVEG
jgi:large subunit ribosomal protein L10e